MKKISFLFLFLSAAVLHGQTPAGYVLAKTGLSSPAPGSGSLSCQWVASNNTSKGENFFILENLPAHCTIQSITGPAAQLHPSLPLVGPATLLLGPFPMAANGSATFLVTGNFPGDSATGESFLLLSDSQLAAMGRQAPFAGALIEGGTPTAVLSPGLVQSAVAAPNISDGNQPVHFLLNLNSPAKVNLSLFALTGEKIFDTQEQEGRGTAALSWDGRNNARQAVASGLYIYLLRASGDGSVETRTGKVLIVH
jgi:hypothetical protein